jgi:ABC-2 type transport system ATP-binding protein
VDVVVTQNLRKSYGAFPVLHGIDLRVPAGALYGFLGPNGAGKSTTIRILLGLLRRDAGTACVLGEDVWRTGPRLRARVGYLPGDIRWYDSLTGRTTLDFLQSVRGRDCGDEIRRLTDVFELDLTRKVRTYSRGMKQKLGIIQALMHQPELLILDEPTTGLDPLMQAALHDELRRVAAQGRTVLFSSHTLSEVARLCDWVGILRSGRLIEQTPMAVLSERAVQRVEITFDGATPDALHPPAHLHVENRNGHRLTGSWSGPTGELIAWLHSQPIVDLVVAPPALEDLFRAYYAEDAA